MQSYQPLLAKVVWKGSDVGAGLTPETALLFGCDW